MGNNTFTQTDKEIILVVGTLFYNFNSHDEVEKYLVRKIVHETLQDNPTDYVSNFQKETVQNSSLLRLVSNDNWSNLMVKLKKAIESGGTLECEYNNLKLKIKKACPHDVFAMMLSGNTGFPTTKSKCSFYTYYLLAYLLTYKYRVWKSDTVQNALIPCNSDVIKNAVKRGYIAKKSEPTLANARRLTDVARKKYGDEFYKLFEELNNV